MTHSYDIITIFGGSGFVGRAIAARAARAGYTVRLATRNPKACYALKTLGTPGQIVPQYYHPGRPDTIAACVAGSAAVVNCVGILFARGRSTFHAAHVELPRQLATACKRYQVPRLVQISALGVDQSRSSYAKTKGQGEHTVHDIFPAATILRPSVIFGPDDNFFNMFARMSQVMPFLPLIGGGKTRFQPVYVGDVAEAAFRIADGAVPDAAGKTYELGGPETVDFRGVYERLFAHTGQPRPLVPVPFALARIQAWFLSWLPKPLLTPDQVRSLETDSVVAAGAPGFRELGMMPTAMDTILPGYLSRFRPGGKFAEVRRA